MRSLETLLREFPNKTGTQILDIQEADKLKDSDSYRKENKRKLEIIEDYNKNGAYFKSTFGTNQYRFEKFSHLTLQEDSQIYCKVETIVGFYVPDNYDHGITIERRINENQNLEMYMPQEKNRIQKEEFDKLSTTLNNIFKDFWGAIDQDQFRPKIFKNEQ